MSGVYTRTLRGRISHGVVRPSAFASCFRKSTVSDWPASKYGAPPSGDGFASCTVAKASWASEYTRTALDSPKSRFRSKIDGKRLAGIQVWRAAVRRWLCLVHGREGFLGIRVHQDCFG